MSIDEELLLREAEVIVLTEHLRAITETLRALDDD